MSNNGNSDDQPNNKRPRLAQDPEGSITDEGMYYRDGSGNPFGGYSNLQGVPNNQVLTMGAATGQPNVPAPYQGVPSGERSLVPQQQPALQQQQQLQQKPAQQQQQLMGIPSGGMDLNALAAFGSLAPPIQQQLQSHQQQGLPGANPGALPQPFNQPMQPGNYLQQMLQLQQLQNLQQLAQTAAAAGGNNTGAGGFNFATLLQLQAAGQLQQAGVAIPPNMLALAAGFANMNNNPAIAGMNSNDGLLLQIARQMATTPQSSSGKDPPASTAADAPSFAAASSAPPLPRVPHTLTGRAPVAMSMPSDEERLSAYHALARKHIEFFEAGQDDISTNARGRNRPIVLGQVGIRCRHCAHLAPRHRQRAAMYYPFKLELLYQACQTLANVHLCEQCKLFPADVREELVKYREGKTTALVGKKYWAEGARFHGIFESEDGLRFHKLEEKPKSKEAEKLIEEVGEGEHGGNSVDKATEATKEGEEGKEEESDAKNTATAAAVTESPSPSPQVDP